MLTTRQAGERLGGLHPKDVRRLARLGLLRGKTMVVRGHNKKPRMAILESSVEEYIQGLPDASPTKAESPPPARRRERRGRLDGVIEFV